MSTTDLPQAMPPPGGRWTAPARPLPAPPRITGPVQPGMLQPPMPALAAPRRVTVVGESGRIDVALPAQSTIAELLPVLVRATTAPGDLSAHRGGFVLSRVGGARLPGDRTVAAVGLRDGELLHVTPVGHAAAAVIFDDLVDAVASEVSDAPGRWTPALSRRFAAVAAALAFGGVALVAVTMESRPAGPIAAALTAVLLLVAGVTLSRARDAAAVGSALAGAGLPGVLTAAYAAFPGGPARAMAAAFAAVSGYALLSAVLLPAYRIWFCTAAGAGGGAAIAGAVVATGSADATSAAAVLIVLAVVISPAFPILSLRLGRLPVPEVPNDMAAFRAAEKPTPAAEVAGRTRAAQAALTSLLTAEALIVLAGGLLLVRIGTLTGWILTGVAGLALLVRSRAYLSLAQRGVLLGAGTTILAATAVRLVTHGGDTAALTIGALALLIGAGCAVHAVRAGRRPPSPYWAQFLDIVDFIAVTSLVPAGAAVLGLYGSIQALAG
jgi:type VII secretion integral membrane protein EccD